MAILGTLPGSTWIEVFPQIMLNSLRHAIRKTGQPLVAAARRLLSTPEPVSRLESVEIEDGVAAGLTIQLPVPSALAAKICGNQYELQCIRICQRLVGTHDQCWDLGAHYGFYTLLLARLASRGQVHAFEPLKRLADSIQHSIASSKLTNATVHHLALSHRTGEAAFRFAQQDFLDDSMSYLLEYGGVTTERSLVQYTDFSECLVACKRLDELDLPPPQFIKMDVEGAEAAVLAGGRTLLLRARPRLLIELHGVDLALQASEILRSLGYSGRPVGPRASIMPVLFLHESDRYARDQLQWQADIDWMTDHE